MDINVDILKDLQTMNDRERNIIVAFLMKLQEAFKVEGLDTLKDSTNPICKEIYGTYEQLSNVLNG